MDYKPTNTQPESCNTKCSKETCSSDPNVKKTNCCKCDDCKCGDNCTCPSGKINCDPCAEFVAGQAK